MNEPGSAPTRAPPKNFVRVHFSNESAKIFPVEPDTTVADIVQHIVERLDLQTSSRMFFGLWIVGEKTSLQLQLPPQVRLETVIRYFPELEKHYKGESKSEARVVFKRKALITVAAERTLADTVAVSLLYDEAVMGVRYTPIPMDMEHSTALAGLQMQVTYGNFRHTLNCPGFLLNKMNEFMPHRKVRSKSKKQLERIEKLVFDQHQVHRGRSPLLLKLLYLESAQQHELYGSVVFKTRHVAVNGKVQEGELTLAISTSQLTLIDEEKKSIVLRASTTNHSLKYSCKGEGGTAVFCFDFNERKKARSVEFPTREAGVIKNLLDNIYQGAMPDDAPPDPLVLPPEGASGAEHAQALARMVEDYRSGVVVLAQMGVGGTGIAAEASLMPAQNGGASSEESSDGLPVNDDSESSDGIPLSYYGA